MAGIGAGAREVDNRGDSWLRVGRNPTQRRSALRYDQDAPQLSGRSERRADRPLVS